MALMMTFDVTVVEGAVMVAVVAAILAYVEFVAALLKTRPLPAA